MAHVAINAQLASHKGRGWVHFAIKDRFEHICGRGQCHIGIFFAGARAVAVDDDATFAFDIELCGAVKASPIHLGVQGGDGFVYNITHVFVLCQFFVTVPPLVLADQYATLVVMGTQTHRIKCIVTALFVLVGFSLPAVAQETTLDQLFQELEEADANSYARIEQQIISEWGKSGSAAMDLLLRRGLDALDDGQPDVAVEHFTALVDHAPDFAEGYYGRASSYYLLGLTGPALDDIRQTLSLNPRHFEAMRGLALIMEELGRPNDALELYQMILQINPQSIEIQDAVSRIQLQLEGQAL